MEFDSAVEVYNFYNGDTRRLDFGITNVCSRSNEKKKLCFKHLACWKEEKFSKSFNSMNPRDIGKIDYKASIKTKLNSMTGK